MIRLRMIRSKMICSVMVRNLKTLFVSGFVVSLFVGLLSSIAFGQGGVATGDLHVTVKDPKGNLVANATVTVSDVAKGLERTATGDGEGGYSARLLPPGTYTVTVEAPGFGKAEAKDVSITVGGLVELPVALAVASGREVVEVSSQAELVETSRTSTTDTIGQRRIDNLPINGRNYINFTLTDSQVVRDNAPSLGAAPTSGLNMSGQRARSNLVNVDGADATDNSTERRALHRVAGSGAGIPDHYQQLQRGVWPRRRRSGEHHHALRIECFPRGRIRLFAQPEFSGREPVQHGSESRLHSGAGGCGFRRADQEGQDVLLFFLRNYAPA